MFLEVLRELYRNGGKVIEVICGFDVMVFEVIVKKGNICFKC